MKSFLERYLDGECQQVWSDLLALGTEVREGLIFEDARGVAQETMRRAHYNIELLVQRWESIGYVFGYDWIENIASQEEQGIDNWQSLEGLSSHLESTEKQLRQAGMTETEMKVFLDREKANTMEMTSDVRKWAKMQPPVLMPPSENIASFLKQWEEAIGVLPLSLYAWYELVGTVNFTGTLPPSWQPYVESDVEAKFQFWSDERRHNLDPLFVAGIESQSNKETVDSVIQSHQEGEGKVSTSIWIAPDEFFKDYSGGGRHYTINIPDVCADVLLRDEWHHTTFVNYLRVCFQWGGLPGLETWDITEDKMDFLREGLLPI